MATLFNIMKVTVEPDKLTARVLVNPRMPLRTSEDVEATARVYYLAPAIAEHMCLGDAGSKFQDCMADTELAHLLEHLTVEIMNETGLAGRVSCGRTRGVENDPRLFDVELSCPDDALTIGALSSATFMMDWAFLHADQTPPDFPGTVDAMRNLVLSLRGELGVGGGADDGASDDTVGTEDADGTGDGSADESAAPEASAGDGYDVVSGPIDTEGAAAQAYEGAPQAVFGGAAAEGVANAPVAGDDAHDPDATVSMPPLQ